MTYTLITLAIFHHLLSHYHHPLRSKEPGGKEVMMIISKLNRTEPLLISKLDLKVVVWTMEGSKRQEVVHDHHHVVVHGMLKIVLKN